jgi:hypothetical protein
VMYGDPARVLGAGFLEVARFPRAVVFRRAVKPRPSESELLRKAAASAASSAAPPSLTDGSAPGRPTNDVYGPSNRADDSRETDTRTPLDTE